MVGRNELRTWITFALVSLLVLPLIAVSAQEPGGPDEPLVLISGNAQLAAVASSGNGTSIDPYIITGFVGFPDIQNTDAYFIFEDSTHTGTSFGNCVNLINVQHAIIRNNVMGFCETSGIEVQGSSDILIENNTFDFGWWNGVGLDSSTAAIVGNTIDGGTFGIQLWFSTATEISGNTITNSGYALGVYTDSFTPVITGNRFINAGGGLFGPVNDSLIVDNLFQGNDFALTAENSTIHHNRFSNNTVDIATASTNNIWDDGYPSGGNYWSVYADVDACSGDAQDICPEPDGIWDTPYPIPGIGEQDSYPFVTMPSGIGTPVVPGFNLLSHVFPGSIDVRALFADYLDGSTIWDRIIAWNGVGWDSIDLSRPAYMNDQINLTMGQAAWVNIVSVGDGEMWFSTASSAGGGVSLQVGWNLVGYPTTTPKNASVAFAGLTYLEALGQNSSAAYSFSPLAPDDLMEPGRGYWISLPSAQVWTP